MAGAQGLERAVDAMEDVETEGDVPRDVHSGDQRILKALDDVAIHISGMNWQDREVQYVVDHEQKKNGA